MKWKNLVEILDWRPTTKTTRSTMTTANCRSSPHCNCRRHQILPSVVLEPAATVRTQRRRFRPSDGGGNEIGYLILLTVFLFTVSAAAFDVTNNKLFTHNRSTNAVDTDTSFFTRLKDLNKIHSNPKIIKGVKTVPALHQPSLKPAAAATLTRTKNKSKKNKTSFRKPSQNQSQSPANYYFSSYAVSKVRNNSNFEFPSPPTTPTRLHPLAVLKTDIKAETAADFARSNLGDLLDDQEARSSELTGPEEDYFKDFRDHVMDPMAAESGGPAPAYAKPPPYTATGTGSGSASAPSASASASAPSAPASGSSMTNQISPYPMRMPMSNLPTGFEFSDSNKWDQKNVNFWPQNLNSYYGQDFTNNYNHLIAKRPHRLDNSAPQSVSGSGYGNEVVAASTNTLQKVSMIDRVSSFYTNYKLLAWGGIILAASFALLGALLTLYWKNPPTEVVTARDVLARGLTDPTLMIFVSEALRKFEETHMSNKDRIDNRGKRRKVKVKVKEMSNGNQGTANPNLHKQ